MRMPGEAKCVESERIAHLPLVQKEVLAWLRWLNPGQSTVLLKELKAGKVPVAESLFISAYTSAWITMHCVHRGVLVLAIRG